MMRWLLLLVGLLLWSLPVRATTRLAIVVGRNDGSPERPPLRRAESDARRMADALVRYGKVGRDDLHLLVGQPRPAHLLTIIEQVRQRLRVLEHDGVDTLLFFYFSGHSDGVALELGRERFPIIDLQKALQGLARVRVDIMDTCRAPGLARGPDDIPEVLYDDKLATEGWVVLTASDRNESAREWQDRGGIFTHHLILALSGEADRKGKGDQDGRVTLTEAFEYAAGGTLFTSAHAGHPQNPQIQLDHFKGRRANLVLAELSPPDAWIELPGGFDVVYLFEETNEVYDHRERRPVRVAVRAGRYRVVALRLDGPLEAEVTVRPGKTETLRGSDLRALPTLLALRDKGGAASPRSRRSRLTLAFAGGVMGPFADRGVDALATVSLGVRASGASGWMAQGVLGAGPATFGAESTLLLLAGYRWGRSFGRATPALGLLAGGGLSVQSLMDGDNQIGMAATLVVSPWVGLAWRLSPRWELSLEGQVPLGWGYFAGDQPNPSVHTFKYLPGGWLGLLATL